MCATVPDFLCGSWTSELRSPSLCSKYFTHETISAIFRDAFDYLIEGEFGCYWHLRVEVRGYL